MDDATSAGHLLLQQQRQLLYYLRLIEHEMPKLVGEFALISHNVLLVVYWEIRLCKHIGNPSFLHTLQCP